MFDTTREIVAYTIIGIVTIMAVPWLRVVHLRRKRRELRRQGIKRYGH